MEVLFSCWVLSFDFHQLRRKKRGVKFAARRDMLALNSRMRVAIAMALVALLVPTMAVAATAPNILSSFSRTISTRHSVPLGLLLTRLGRSSGATVQRRRTGLPILLSAVLVGLRY